MEDYPMESREKENVNYLSNHDDFLIQFLHKVIRQAVRFLSILMVIVILFGIVDVIYTVYQRLSTPPFLLLNINNILSTFGAFLAVLIAIEIFINISLYLRNDVIHVTLVIETALMAICRKVIVFNFKELTPLMISSTAAVIMALGITYWLILRKTDKEV
jgi:uncharacterized membrane protein (DUF373 family)